MSDTKRELIKRLMLIRYIHSQAEKQSRQRGPRAVVSILMYHDAIDLWLQLAAQHLEVKTGQQTYFPQYINSITDSLKEDGRQLAQALPMQRLNAARNSFKHKGILPDTDFIQSSRVYVRDFLNENTLTVFDVHFLELTLVDLVEEGLVKDLLVMARQSLKSGDYNSVAATVTIAFRILIVETGFKIGDTHDPEWRVLSSGTADRDENSLRELELPGPPNPEKRVRLSIEALLDRRPVPGSIAELLIRSIEPDWPGRDSDEPLRAQELIPYLNDLGGRIDQLEYAVKLVEYGIDIRDYRKFFKLMPKYGIESSGDGSIAFGLVEDESRDYYPDADPYSENEAQFMLDFVTECALQIQGRDAEDKRA